jgi:hypothetical protein
MPFAASRCKRVGSRAVPPGVSGGVNPLTGAGTAAARAHGARVAFRLLEGRVEPSPMPPVSRTFRAVAAVVVASSAAYAWGTNGADEDLWNHLTFGAAKLRALTVPRVEASSYSAAGHPWFNHEWGTEVVFAALFRWGGAPALFVLKFVLGLAVLAAMVDAARTLARASGVGRLHPGTAAAGLVVVFAALAPGASFRPQLFTMACLAVEWALLERAERRLYDPTARPIGWQLACVPFVVLVWTNTHGGFPVGVALHGAFVAGVLVRHLVARSTGGTVASPAALGGVVASGIATLVATAANPYGLGLHRYLLTTIADHDRITEWLPMPLPSAAHAPFEILVMTTVLVTVPWTLRRAGAARVDWRLAFVALAGIAAIRHQRHSVLFAIVAGPMALVAVEDARRRLLARWPVLAWSRATAAAIACGALGVVAIQLFVVGSRYAGAGFAIQYRPEEFPADAVRFLAAEGVEGNWAVQFEWGGYAIHHMGPRFRVFIDGRYEAAYPPDVMHDYFTFVDGAPGWERVLDAYPTDGVLIDRTSPVVPRLDARPDLVRLYADGTAVVYLRRSAANAPTVQRLTALASRVVPSSPSWRVFP